MVLLLPITVLSCPEPSLLLPMAVMFVPVSSVLEDPIMVDPKAAAVLPPPITVDRPPVYFTVLPTPATKALSACTLLDVPNA